MKNNINFYIFLLYFTQIISIIVIPFQLSELIIEEYLDSNYSVNDYFSDFFLVDYYSSLNIGSKDMRILTRISQDNNSFFLSEEECKRKTVDHAENYGIISRNKYRLSQSSSYKNISIFNNSLINNKIGGIISDTFSFYNTTKLKCHPLSYKDALDNEIDSKIDLDEFKIIIENFTDNGLCALIGMGKPDKDSNVGVNLINELKKNGIINDYSFTYNYVNSYTGQLIIGALPHEYIDSKLYKPFQYININSYSVNDNTLPWSILFNKIYIDRRNSSIINVQNNVKSYIVHKLGFIIGTTQYKKLILEHFFNPLINEKICFIEKIKNINYKIYDLKNEYYELFYCDEYKFKDNHRILFPSLKFQQKDLEYDFNFHFYFLFNKFNERYYFLVLFPEEKLSNNNWYLGLPFLKRYQFIFNYDSKTIGFYNDKMELKNKTKSDKDENFFKSHLRLFMEIGIGILLIGLIYIAYIIGQKINTKRKKRANELDDDSFEYFSKDKNENSKNIIINEEEEET